MEGYRKISEREPRMRLRGGDNDEEMTGPSFDGLLRVHCLNL